MIDQLTSRPSALKAEQRNDSALSVLRSHDMRGHAQGHAWDEGRSALAPLRHPIVGTSGATRAALRDASRVAPTDVPILLQGETGTGKDLFARAIHEWSQRAARPLVRVDCASLTRSPWERESSNHAPGAFGAVLQRRLDSVDLASGSTLLLDEIGELSVELQSKLLHVLREGECGSAGSPSRVHTDVRIIAATNRVLANDVATGRFRADLYYRIAGFVIQLPALRDRRDDIVPLVKYFLGLQSKRLKRTLPFLPTAVLNDLASYAWPGNVHELHRSVERACIVARNEAFGVNDFAIVSPKSAAARTEGPGRVRSEDESPILTLRELERQHIASVLRRCGGVVEGTRGAAFVLGIPPSSLRFRMRKHGIERRHRDPASRLPKHQETTPR